REKAELLTYVETLAGQFALQFSRESQLHGVACDARQPLASIRPLAIADRGSDGSVIRRPDDRACDDEIPARKGRGRQYPPRFGRRMDAVGDWRGLHVAFACGVDGWAGGNGAVDDRAWRRRTRAGFHRTKSLDRSSFRPSAEYSNARR